MMALAPSALKRLAALSLPFLICAACASSPSAQESPIAESLIEGGISAVYPGPLDSKNHYLSNVAIHTNAKREDGSEHCSGVLVNSRNILTAGHCVCMKRKLSTTADRQEVAQRLQEAIPSVGKEVAARDAIEALRARVLANSDSLIDNSLCANLVEVEVAEYLPPQPNMKSRLLKSRYIGKIVHPHPRLLVLDDATGTSWFREADLALIHLATPVSERFRPIKFPEREVQVGSSIVMVGYGFGQDGDITSDFGDRHYGESVIATVERLASGSVKFIAHAPSRGDRPTPRVYGGDSGGGGFSKADDSVLVGMISAFARDGESSIFTSVYAYREWLKKELNDEDAATVAP
jgi:hypothetical protein